MRAALLVAALSLSCGGAQVRTSEAVNENGMWSICYKEGTGRAELHETRDENHSCSNPVRLKWAKLPVKVHLAGATPADPFLRAFSAWEGWLGTPVFELVPESGDDVVEAFVVDDETAMYFRMMGIAAMAPHWKRMNGTIKAEVWMSPLYYDNVEVIAHELGHILGLAHDHGNHNKRSIMYPGTSWYLPSVSNYDKRLLCALYRC